MQHIVAHVKKLVEAVTDLWLTWMRLTRGQDIKCSLLNFSMYVR